MPLLFRGLEDCDQGGEHKENVNIALHQVNEGGKKTDLESLMTFKKKKKLRS